VNPGKNDNIGTGTCCLLRKSKRIAEIVGNILNIRVLVVVGKNNSIEFFFQGINCPKQVVGEK
jgi:hypothetical protein